MTHTCPFSAGELLACDAIAAAKSLGRRAIGVELEERYAETRPAGWPKTSSTSPGRRHD